MKSWTMLQRFISSSTTERGLVRIWIRAGCARPSCDGQGCFEWIPLFHIPDTWSFLRALLRGSSNSGRKRRTFRNWRSGTAWAPGSNNSLDRNNSFSTGRFLFQFSGNTQHVKRHLKAQIILNAESQMFFLQSFALWMMNEWLVQTWTWTGYNRWNDSL